MKISTDRKKHKFTETTIIKIFTNYYCFIKHVFYFYNLVLEDAKILKTSTAKYFGPNIFAPGAKRKDAKILKPS